jgi:hypothetical protein
MIPVQSTRVACGRPELLPRDITPGNFVTELCRSLAWDIRPVVHIERMYYDQWFGSTATDYDQEDAIAFPGAPGWPRSGSTTPTSKGSPRRTQ